MNEVFPLLLFIGRDVDLSSTVCLIPGSVTQTHPRNLVMVRPQYSQQHDNAPKRCYGRHRTQNCNPTSSEFSLVMKDCGHKGLRRCGYSAPDLELFERASNSSANLYGAACTTSTTAPPIFSGIKVSSSLPYSDAPIEMTSHLSIALLTLPYLTRGRVP